MNYNILVIGKGGREHAMAWKFSQSPCIKNIFVCPGNAGTAIEENISNVDIPLDDLEAIIKFVKMNDIHLTVVGPEDPLVNGIANRFHQEGLKIFGPKKEFAQLEGSKVFSKDFMDKYNISTPRYKNFSSKTSAIEYIKEQIFPIVVKADGLAAGKGVIIASNCEEAKNAVDKLFDLTNSNNIVIEEFVTGQELSAIYVCNFGGCSNEIALPWTKDYKSRDEFNSGPNTGGMGAVSHPLCYEHKNFIFKLHIDIEVILIQTITAINTIYKTIDPGYLGFLYIGLMIDKNNNLKVLEYNCRLGDPETQNLMLQLNNKNIDLLDLILNKSDKEIKTKDLNLENMQEEKSHYCCTIVLAAQGYPEKPELGFFLDTSAIIESDKIKIFHAGTSLTNGKIQVTGGRILTINVYSDTKSSAIDIAYENIKKIIAYEDEQFNQKNQDLVFYREDIGN